LAIGHYPPSTHRHLKNLRYPYDPTSKHYDIINVRILNIQYKSAIRNGLRDIIDRDNIIIYLYIFTRIENLQLSKNIFWFAIAGNEKRTSGVVFQLLVHELRKIRNGLAEILQVQPDRRGRR